MNLLEIGKIVRVHGVKGAVKIISYVDENFSTFKGVYIGQKRVKAKVVGVKPLNGDAFSVSFDIMPTIDAAQNFINQSVYIDRTEYKEFEDKIYLSDLINKPVLSESGEQLGFMVDFDDYGASVVLTIKSGINSYQIPYVEEIISYNRDLESFIINKQKFEDMRI